MVEGGSQSHDGPRAGGVVADHFATLRGAKGRVLWAQVTLQLVVPVVAGAAVIYFAVRLTIVGELIAGSAVIAGLLFGLVIFIFQLRLGLTTDPRVQSKTAVPELIDQLFSNVLYAVVTSFTFVVAAVLFAALEPIDSKTNEALGLEPWMGAVLVALGLHLLAVIYMCIRRTRRAYLELRR